ncbi:MAG: hypothetical protein R3E83_12045 [Burkholderiaceae bacterium]
MIRTALAAAAIGLAISTPVLADELGDTLKAALSSYEAGDLSRTNEDLTYAMQLLNQRRADALQKFLPEALDGWELSKSKGSNNGAGMAMFGGGLTANAVYRRDRERIEVQIIANSPMIASMAMIFNNPAAIGAQGKITRIGREKVLIKNDGEMQSLVDNRILVQVSGKAPAEAMEAYFRKIDLNGLKDF